MRLGGRGRGGVLLCFIIRTDAKCCTGPEGTEGFRVPGPRGHRASDRTVTHAGWQAGRRGRGAGAGCRRGGGGRGITGIMMPARRGEGGQKKRVTFL